RRRRWPHVQNDARQPPSAMSADVSSLSNSGRQRAPCSAAKAGSAGLARVHASTVTRFATQFDQRAKIDVYDNFVFIVVYGAQPVDHRLVEVHCFYSERFLITVHREACPAFTEIRKRYQQREKAIEQPSLLLYRVIDGLVDSFFPSLAALDDRIDELEDGTFLNADDNQLQAISQMKRPLVTMRKAATPQRDAF